MLEIDFNKLKKQVKQLKSRQSEPTLAGVDRVLYYMCILEDTKHIDFDSFTLDDCDEALEELYKLPIMDYDNGEYFYMNPDNRITLTYHRLELTGTFKTYSKKKYIPDENDVFL